MKNKIIALFLLLALLILIIVFAAKDIGKNNKGVKYFKEGDYEKASSIFDEEVNKNPGKLDLVNNAAAAGYKKGSFDTSFAGYKSVLDSIEANAVQKAVALYGLGNIEYKKNNFEKAASFYKEALKINSQDNDAKYNLEAALKKIEEQKQQDEKDKKDEKQKDQQQQQQQKDMKQQMDENNQKQKQNEEQRQDSEQKQQEAQKKEDESKQDKSEAQQKQKEIEEQMKDNENDGGQNRKELEKQLEEQKQKEEQAAKQEEASRKEQEKQQKRQEELNKEKAELDKQREEINKKIEEEKNKQQQQPVPLDMAQEQKDAKEPENKDAPAGVLLDYFNEADKNADKLRNRNKSPMLNQPLEDW